MIEWCFMPLSTVFQSYHRHSSHYSCAQGHSLEKKKKKNPEDPVWLEARTPGLRVKHFTTEQHRTPVLERVMSIHIIEMHMKCPNIYEKI